MNIPKYNNQKHSNKKHKIEINKSQNNNLLCGDKTLPRTKDYICRNKSCISHNKSDIKRTMV